MLRGNRDTLGLDRPLGLGTDLFFYQLASVLWLNASKLSIFFISKFRIPPNNEIIKMLHHKLYPSTTSLFAKLKERKKLKSCHQRGKENNILRLFSTGFYLFFSQLLEYLKTSPWVLAVLVSVPLAFPLSLGRTWWMEMPWLVTYLQMFPWQEWWIVTKHADQTVGASRSTSWQIPTRTTVNWMKKTDIWSLMRWNQWVVGCTTTWLLNIGLVKNDSTIFSLAV